MATELSVHLQFLTNMVMADRISLHCNTYRDTSKIAEELGFGYYYYYYYISVVKEPRLMMRSWLEMVALSTSDGSGTCN